MEIRLSIRDRIDVGIYTGYSADIQTEKVVINNLSTIEFINS
jgi:hypothetical protein